MTLNSLLEPGTVGVDNDPEGSHLLEPQSQSEQQTAKVGPVNKLNPVMVDKLEVPPLVRAMLARLVTLSSDELLEYEREFKLSYYYEGHCVAVRATSSGPEVVAYGRDDEVLTIVRSLPTSESQRITIVDPTPLVAIAGQLPRPMPSQVG